MIEADAIILDGHGRLRAIDGAKAADNRRAMELGLPDIRLVILARQAWTES